MGTSQPSVISGVASVIVVNNDTANPDTYVGMSGADATITIPAVFVTYNIGEAIIAAMGSETVNVTLRNEPITFVNSDGMSPAHLASQ